MESSHTCRGSGRPKKTIRETVKKDLELNELDKNMVFDRSLSSNLIHIELVVVVFVISYRFGLDTRTESHSVVSWSSNLN